MEAFRRYGPGDQVHDRRRFEQIIGKSSALEAVLEQVERVAPTGSTVLIEGETGTGKELIARAIHDLSARRERTFVKLNCAAIPTGLLESELFGHERGAFTGAIAQKFGLQCQRNIAHLVQEKRAFVGQLKTADLLRYGAGERASFVTKKLTFQQIERDSSAIQLYKRTPASRAEVVNCLRDQFLAGACLPLDKNGGIGRRHPFHLLKNLFQSRAPAYDLFESAPIMYLVT